MDASRAYRHRYARYAAMPNSPYRFTRAHLLGLWPLDTGLWTVDTTGSALGWSGLQPSYFCLRELPSYPLPTGPACLLALLAGEDPSPDSPSFLPFACLFILLFNLAPSPYPAPDYPTPGKMWIPLPSRSCPLLASLVPPIGPVPLVSLSGVLGLSRRSFSRLMFPFSRRL